MEDCLPHLGGLSKPRGVRLLPLPVALRPCAGLPAVCVTMIMPETGAPGTAGTMKIAICLV
jgi:hypothetical protein